MPQNNGDASGKKMRLPSMSALKNYQKKWWQETHARLRRGEPYAICMADDAEDIFTAFDIPVIVTPWWSAVISAKQMSAYYGEVLAKHGYDMNPYYSLGLGVTLDNNPEKAPWGGLPKPALIIGSTAHDFNLRITEIWAREYGCPCFPLEVSYLFPSNPYPHRWWEKIRDRWDEVIESHRIDKRVEEMKDLIRFIEINTGRHFSPARLAETMELVNEQEDYWARARDLIADSSPCPVTLSDQLSMYAAQWHRGKPEGRDIIKMFYEDVKERVENGISDYPDEKIRLMWNGIGLFTNMSFFEYFQEKYGANFVCSIYTSIAADGYARRVIDNDPLRALASRFAWLGVLETEWVVKIAQRHKCDGVVMFSNGPCSSLHAKFFEKAGIPVCEIPGDNVDSRKWDDAKIRSIVSSFIETRIIS
ncbi:2-hydroxyacyl-CoA dehydratase subunit D [Thermodesulfobacteriota bacterium]